MIFSTFRATTKIIQKGLKVLDLSFLFKDAVVGFSIINASCHRSKFGILVLRNSSPR